ncbi:hypothetical protein ASE14_06505 [Agromyces sp. Root81]|uniref:hypothetical protein n=1 Tax=Agromyces sp. Root81 TaxID=1736601 RepID=UPI0006F41192|nr:hypothetical protein [Agromyces sp. Root81]KRC60638.1 hypothetical protein ASE14_06505 [Agromyces sp. Root81]
MERAPAFRIVRWELKVLYIVVAWIVGFAIADLLRALGAPVVVIEAVALLTTFGPFALAVRIFRGQGEAIDPPRAWWRMTAWPTLSRRLGILFGALAASTLIGLVLEAAGVTATSVPLAMPVWIGSTLQYAVLAFFYLNSAVRMARVGIAKPERLRPTMRLK